MFVFFSVFWIMFVFLLDIDFYFYGSDMVGVIGLVGIVGVFVMLIIGCLIDIKGVKFVSFLCMFIFLFVFIGFIRGGYWLFGLILGVFFIMIGI